MMDGWMDEYIEEWVDAWWNGVFLKYSKKRMEDVID